MAPTSLRSLQLTPIHIAMFGQLCLPLLTAADGLPPLRVADGEVGAGRTVRVRILARGAQRMYGARIDQCAIR